MIYSRCGKSGVLLPKISLGFWHNFGETTPFETSRDIVLTAYSEGIVHFDLANNYGPRPGAAEQRLGKILHEDLAAHRDELFISSKAGYDMWEGPYGSWGSRKHIIASINQSLRRLGVDYLDVFYSHRYDPDTPLEETLQSLVDIVRSGKALYVGISRWPIEATRFGFQYLRERDVPCLLYQGRLNILDRAPEQEGILALCEEEGVGFIGFTPLAQGLLTDRYLEGIPSDSRLAHSEHFQKQANFTDELQQRLRSLNDIATKRGESLASMSLSWILHHRAVTSVIIGASSAEQVRKNLKALESPVFTPSQLKSIETLSHSK